MSEQEFDILIEDSAIESRFFVRSFLKEEGSAAFYQEWDKFGLEDSLVSNEVGQSQVVNEKYVTNYQKVEVGTMSRQQHNRNLTILLDLSDLFESLHIDAYLLI